MGDSKTAQAGGETAPITMRNGRFRHSSTYTLLDLGEYDVVLGMPFFRYHKVVLSTGDDLPKVTVSTLKGPRSLPVRIGKARDTAIFQVATVADLRAEAGPKAELFQLVLKNGLIDPSLDDIMEGPVKFEWVPPANEPSLVPETGGSEPATTEVPPPPVSGRTTTNCQDDEARNRAQERKNTNFGEASRNNQKSDVSETLRKARVTPGESSPKVSHKYGTQEQSSVKLKRTSDLAKLDASPETST